MNFGQAIQSCFKNYIGFEGRACRSEFWYWTLFFMIVSVATLILDSLLFTGSVMLAMDSLSPLNTLFSLALFLPSLALIIRRLHDTGRSGWWVLPVFIPVVGIIFYIAWGAQKGDGTSNQFGANPLAPVAA